MRPSSGFKFNDNSEQEDLGEIVQEIKKIVIEPISRDVILFLCQRAYLKGKLRGLSEMQGKFKKIVEGFERSNYATG